MSAARIFIMVLAIGAAGGAAFLVRNIVASRPSEAVQVIVEKEEVAKDEVLTITRDMRMGQTVVDGDLNWIEWPLELASEDFILRSAQPELMEELMGSVVRSDFIANEPVLRRKLVKLGDKSMMSLLLKKGMRAVTIAISPVRGSGGFILPGDHVDILLSRRESAVLDQDIPLEDGDDVEIDPQAIRPVGEGFSTETILANVKVLAVDQIIGDIGENPSVPASTATLEVTPEQAELVELAKRVGQMSLLLRPFADSLGPNGEPKDDSIPVVVGKLGTPPPPRPKSEIKGIVTIVRNGTVTLNQTELAN